MYRVSKDLNIPTSTFSFWKSGRSYPKQDKIMTIARYFGVSSDYFYTGDPGTPQVPLKVPIYGYVAAGVPIESIQNIIGYVDIPVENIHDNPKEYFALEIDGHSMEPEINNGDIVIVHHQPDADDGQTVIVAINGDKATCKKLKRYDNGIALISNNPEYQPMYFSSKEVASIPVTIIGLVMELRRTITAVDPL